MNNEQPSINDVIVATTTLLRAVKPIGEASLNELARHVGEHVARLTVDSPIDDVHAVIALADALEARLMAIAAEIEQAQGAEG